MPEVLPKLLRSIAVGAVLSAVLVASSVHAQADHCNDLDVRNALARETVPNFVDCEIGFVQTAWRKFAEQIPLTVVRGEPGERAGIVSAQAPQKGQPTAYLEAGLQVTVSTSAIPQTPTVVVRASGSASEGKPIRFEITRTPSGTPLSIRYETAADGEAVADVDFTPTAGQLQFGESDAPQILPVQTAFRAGANGARRVGLRVTPVTSGEFEPVEAEGLIVDVADPVQKLVASWSLASDGRSVLVRVQRLAPGAEYLLRIAIASNFDTYLDTSAQELPFVEGAIDAEQSVFFDDCANEVRLTLLDPTGSVSIVNARKGYRKTPSASCRADPTPWWFVPVIVFGGIVLVGGTTVAGRKLWRWLFPLPVPTFSCAIEHGPGNCGAADGLPFAVPPLRLAVITKWGPPPAPGNLIVLSVERFDA